MSLETNLRDMEVCREEYWRRHADTSAVKLRWRAVTMRHCFHVLPGETILELGAGSGLWTQHLSAVLKGECRITAAVFNDEFISEGKEIPGVTFKKVENLLEDLPAESFDYVVGTAILCHDLYPQNLAALQRLLKPGGQLLFYEANYWNPQVFIKNHVPYVRQLAKMPKCQVGMRKYELMKMASHQGFTHLEIIPYDIIHAMTPRSWISTLQSMAFLLEHTPFVRDLCGTLYIWAKKPGDEAKRRPIANLATHPELYDSVSFVVPCYNEEMNIPSLVDSIVQMYGDYVHEIVIVNDNSKDNTAAVAESVAAYEPRVKLVNRKPPGGVGRALKDGYAAANGKYILTMDCDFVQILPEFRDLFDAIAAGYDGAIGSRFSHDSVLINYPFLKILCNRGFHLMVNLLLPGKIRDISNNLKIYKAHILKDLDIEQPHFAANVETGLKPILSGYDIQEVPISWINRTVDMGTSTFNIAKVAPNYFAELMSIVWSVWRGKKNFVRRNASQESKEAISPAKQLVKK